MCMLFGVWIFTPSLIGSKEPFPAVASHGSHGATWHGNSAQWWPSTSESSEWQISQISINLATDSNWLVVNKNLPLWKMMEWVKVSWDDILFPIYGKYWKVIIHSMVPVSTNQARFQWRLWKLETSLTPPALATRSDSFLHLSPGAPQVSWQRIPEIEQLNWACHGPVMVIKSCWTFKQN